jgi:DNA repair protein RadC
MGVMHRIPRYHVELVRESSISIEAYPRFSNSRSAFEIFQAEFANLDREAFYIVTLDSKNRMIGMHHISTGSLSSSTVHPREVLKSGVLDSAAAILLMHNHVSGDPVPSREDRECTSRLVEASKILGIRVLDHIIFGGETDYYSFADAGTLGESLP